MNSPSPLPARLPVLFGQSLLRDVGDDMLAEMGTVRVDAEQLSSTPELYRGEGSMALLVHLPQRASMLLLGPGILEEQFCQHRPIDTLTKFLNDKTWPGVDTLEPGVEIYAVRLIPLTEPGMFGYVAARRLKPDQHHRWQPFGMTSDEPKGAFEDPHHLFHMFTSHGPVRIPSPAHRSLKGEAFASCARLPLWARSMDEQGQLKDFRTLPLDSRLSSEYRQAMYEVCASFVGDRPGLEAFAQREREVSRGTKREFVVLDYWFSSPLMGSHYNEDFHLCMAISYRYDQQLRPGATHYDDRSAEAYHQANGLMDAAIRYVLPMSPEERTALSQSLRDGTFQGLPGFSVPLLPLSGPAATGSKPSFKP